VKTTKDKRKLEIGGTRGERFDGAKEAGAGRESACARLLVRSFPCQTSAGSSAASSRPALLASPLRIRELF
jgi:hypothetical protein